MKRSRKPGKVIGIKVESSRKEDSPKYLATQLASYLQRELNARADAKAFREQAMRERQKAKELGNVLVMLKEYNKTKDKAIKNGEAWEPSRMEPMESYDEAALKTERGALIDRARDMDNSANEYEAEAEKARRKSVEIQQKLVEVKSG